MGRAEVRAFRDFSSSSENVRRGVADRVFITGEGGRIPVGMDEATGYLLGLQVNVNGPINPIQIRNISGVIEIGESD